MRSLSAVAGQSFVSGQSLSTRSTTSAILHKTPIAPECQAARRFIEQRYRHCYAADIKCDYDHFYVVTNSHGDIVAAVGLRLPVETYFLETYLDVPAQTLLSQVYNKPIRRPSTIELGNFTAENAHSAYILMQHCWQKLTDGGYEYLLITCTRSLQRRFRNLPYCVLAKADADRVTNSDQWGSYYEQDPHVICGRLQHYDQRFLSIMSSANTPVNHMLSVRYVHDD